LSDLVESVGLRTLSGVRVLGANVDLQLGELLAAQRGLRKHPAYCLFNGAYGVLLEELGVGDSLQTTRVTRVTVSHLLVEFLTGQGHLVSVDDDDEVAHVNVVCEGCLVLATQKCSSVRGEATEHNVGRVNNDPVALDLTSFRGKSARHSSVAFFSNGVVRESRSEGVVRKSGNVPGGGLTFAVLG
jgi:hypothetical protein